MRRSVFPGLCLVAATCFAQDSPALPGQLRSTPHLLRPRDGSPAVTAELGWLTVLENRARPSGPTIELAFIRFRSATSPRSFRVPGLEREAAIAAERARTVSCQSPHGTMRTPDFQESPFESMATNCLP